MDIIIMLLIEAGSLLVALGVTTLAVCLVIYIQEYVSRKGEKVIPLLWVEKVSMSVEDDTLIELEKDVIDYAIVVAMNRYTDLDKQAAASNQVVLGDDLDTLRSLAELGLVVVNSIMVEALMLKSEESEDE